MPLEHGAQIAQLARGENDHPRFCDGVKGRVLAVVQRTLNRGGIHRQKAPFARKKCAQFCKPAGTFRKNFIEWTFREGCPRGWRRFKTQKRPEIAQESRFGDRFLRLEEGDLRRELAHHLARRQYSPG
jgi:hypothetical protein